MNLPRKSTSRPQVGPPMGGARGPAPVGGGGGPVQALAMDKFREAMMRRMGQGGPSPIASAAAQQAPMNPLRDVLKRRTSRGVLRGMGNPEEHDYR